MYYFPDGESWRIFEKISRAIPRTNNFVQESDIRVNPEYNIKPKEDVGGRDIPGLFSLICAGIFVLLISNDF